MKNNLIIVLLVILIGMQFSTMKKIEKLQEDVYGYYVQRQEYSITRFDQVVIELFEMRDMIEEFCTQQNGEGES